MRLRGPGGSMKYQFVYLNDFKCCRSSVLLAAQSPQAMGAPVEAFKALTSTPRVELSLPSTRCSPGIFGDTFVVPAMMPMVMDDDGWWRWSLMWVKETILFNLCLRSTHQIQLPASSQSTGERSSFLLGTRKLWRNLRRTQLLGNDRCLGNSSQSTSLIMTPSSTRLFDSLKRFQTPSKQIG